MKQFSETRTDDDRCVACGKLIEFTERGLANHRCSERFEAAVVAANRRAEVDRFWKPTWAERLEYGFALLGMGTGS